MTVDLKRKRRMLYRKLLQRFYPMWTEMPETLQLDTQNYCDLDCQYCNVQHSFNLPKGQMPIETIEWILKYFGKEPFFSIAPFMNGEPLLDPRLPEICSMADEYCNTMAVIDTNGTVFPHRLIHPNLKIVRFTISAATPETYEVVHGKPLFYQTMANFWWFMHTKYPQQQPWVHFIATKDNEHEIPEWIAKFQGIGRTVFPVHRSPSIQQDSKQVLGSLAKPFMVLPSNKTIPLARASKYQPCPCWDIMGIAWSGEILQCIDFPYKYNYGKVEKTDLLEAWNERNKNKLDNACCNSCSLRFPNYKEVMDRWIR